MTQKTINHSHKPSINAPFRAKSAGVSFVVVLMIGIYYFVNMLSLLPSNEAVPDGALSLALTAVVLIIVVESVLQIVLFIGAGQIEEQTERDDQVNLMSTRNAYFVLSAGVFATVGSIFVDFTPFEMSSVLLLGFFLAEIVKYGSQLVYYRRSA